MFFVSNILARIAGWVILKLTNSYPVMSLAEMTLTIFVFWVYLDIKNGGNA